LPYRVHKEASRCSSGPGSCSGSLSRMLTAGLLPQAPRGDPTSAVNFKAQGDCFISTLGSLFISRRPPRGGFYYQVNHQQALLSSNKQLPCLPHFFLVPLFCLLYLSSHLTPSFPVYRLLWLLLRASSQPDHAGTEGSSF
jgi:hypothetical protein